MIIIIQPMRNAAFLLVALTVGVSLLVGADGALASAVLTAKSAEARGAAAGTELE